MNTYSTLFIAAFIIIVLTRGNEKMLIKLLGEEGSFLKWAISLGIVYAVAGKLGNFGAMLLALVYVAMFLQVVSKNPKTLENLTDILKK